MAVMELQPWFQRILRAAGVPYGEAIDNDVLAERVEKAFADLQIPMPMVLNCPAYLGNGKVCGARHLDVGEFATKPHHTHSCQECGNTWRPAVRYTVGVQFLPGFKNEPEEDVFDEQHVRERIIPAITKILQHGNDGVREDWRRILTEMQISKP